MTTQAFNNSASYRERAEVLAQDRLHAVAKPASGNPATLYPRLPAGPWSGADMVPVEPPLGRDINALTKETKS
jgi:hypothetical protein